ncbi:MAG: aldo/keto reductase [Chitinophagaceae bacterium]|nr:MAG: aldo/keto reductase [Chitinophagaceae bacterium]
MEKIYLSDAGPKVSPAIYGFYRWTEQDCKQNLMEHVVNHCIELGINTFDHADIYGGYQVEERFGKLIKEKSIKRDDIVLFSKCGRVVPHASMPHVKVDYKDTSKEHIIKSVENSLKKLNTDYIDIYLLNGLDPLSNLEETAQALQNLKDTGKIKNIGVVNFSVFQHQLLASYLRAPIVSNHIELNLLNVDALNNGQLDYIKQRYMRPLATAPLAEGKIALSDDPKAIRLRNVLEAIAPKYHTDIETVAVAWLIQLGALPLIGTTNIDRIKHIVAAFSIELDRQDWYALYSVTQ